MDSNCLDTNALDTLSGKNSRKKSSRKGFKMASSKTLPSSPISEHSLILEVQNFIEGLRTSSQRAYPARLGQEQENNGEQKTKETSGLSPLNASESSSHQLHFLKMSLDSLGQQIAMLKDRMWTKSQLSMFGISELFSENFTKWGIMQDGVCWERTMLAHHITEREYGYWLTPSCIPIAGGKERREKRKKYRESIGRHDVAGSLAEQVAYPEMWPTPRVSDIEGAPAKNAELNNGSWSRLNSKGVRFGIKLKDAVHKMPTPTSRDYKGSSSKILEKGRNPQTNSLCDAIEHKTVGHLNPDWVEALMSWPIGWSSLSPMSIEVFNHWIANHQWEDWEPDIPRVVTEVKDRINRIKAIGNGQVPICMATVFSILFNDITEEKELSNAG